MMTKRAFSRFPSQPCAALLLAAGTLLPLGGASADDALDTIVVTGLRGSQPRTVTDSPAPIDVITGEQLAAAGRGGLLEALGQLAPSLNTPDLAGGDKEGIVRSATLRGLSSAQLLVLVNGKRRHTSAVLNITGLNSAAAPADLDLIPISAIDHVEILRDGAAAQYGSDAIAGVINIILKQTTGGSSVTSAGQGYDGDRETLQEALEYGFEIGDGGILHAALEARHQGNTNKSSGNLYSNIYPLQADGSLDPREAGASKHTNRGYGLPEVDLGSLAYNLELPLNDALTFYSFSSYAQRDGRQFMNYRLPNGRNTITEGPNAAPSGYSPVWYIDEKDYQAAFGLKGEGLAGWNWDLSSTYGRSDAQQSTRHNQNASLGPATPDHFDSGGWVSSQLVSNLDITRAFDIGLARPGDLSLGIEQRHEVYKTEAGDWDSYGDGGYVFPAGHPLAGQRPDPGAQVTNGITPAEADRISRDSAAAYVDVGLNPTERWYVGLAGRYEHYSGDVGSTRSGKLSTRFEFTPAFAVRGTLSNGFRAPALANYIFTTRSTAFATIDGVYQAYNYGILPVDSQSATSLGAKALKPEKSKNYSLGFTYTPSRQLSLSLDAYQIDIDDRITLGGLLRGADVRDILVANGIFGSDGGQYFTNAVDTRTRGVDLVGVFKQDLQEYGHVDWTLAANYNKTRITGVKDNPSQLSSLGGGYELINRQARNLLTDAMPETKLILSGLWSVEQWELLLRLTRYDEFTQVQDASNPSLDRTFGAKWLTDIDVGYHLSKQLTVAAGAKNLFDVYPDDKGVVTSSGFGKYGLYSPFGFSGGYYYTRLSYNF
jgi:iron complex outermembrane receptor protein